MNIYPIKYYVYAYLRKNNTPYYIGKGLKNRAWCKYHSINLPKDKSKIVIMESNLTELGAYALERRYIKWYGRKDLGTGILRNMTDGGEGGYGKRLSEATKKKISEKNSISLKGNIPWNKGKKNIYSKETLEKMGAKNLGKIPYNKGKTLKTETILKIKEKRKNQIITKEHRENISKGLLGKKRGTYKKRNNLNTIEY